jgi:hypothetical protein
VNRLPVSSSNLASVGYAPELRILEVEFLDRSVYQYLKGKEVQGSYQPDDSETLARKEYEKGV